VTISVISMGEVVRTGRYLNMPLALAVAIGPWLTESSTMEYAVIGTILGLAVALLSFPRGQITQTYGNWDRCIR
jgi:hypothetical protein